jgi:hypothetical protein
LVADYKETESGNGKSLKGFSDALAKPELLDRPGGDWFSIAKYHLINNPVSIKENRT